MVLWLLSVDNISLLHCHEIVVNWGNWEQKITWVQLLFFTYGVNIHDALSFNFPGKHAFRVTSTDPELVQSFTFITPDEHDKKQWMQMIRHAVSQCASKDAEADWEARPLVTNSAPFFGMFQLLAKISVCGVKNILQKEMKKEWCSFLLIWWCSQSTEQERKIPWELHPVA